MTISPVNKISGIIESPDSKSHFIRLIAGALLSEDESIIEFKQLNQDIEAALDVAQTLGARIAVHDSKISIKGGFKPFSKHINCGESGLTFRMFAIISALSKQRFTITGTGTLLKRKVSNIEADLIKLGLNTKTQNGELPLEISGTISNNNIEINGSQSSQVLSGILFALAATGKNSRILVENLKSKPYIDLTISALAQFGVFVENNKYKEFLIHENQKFKAIHAKVEADWSGAAFFAVAGAIGGKTEINGLKINSAQADKKVLEALKIAGAEILINDESIIIKKNKLNAFDFDASHCPDLFPPLAVLAANCNGVSEIKGISRLYNKESNRAQVLKNEFAKLGIEIKNNDNIMYVKGSKICGAHVNSNNDHRIAMALSLMSINCKGEIFLENPGVVDKSYTNFFNDFKNVTSR